jgi:hypothetical protein
MCRPLRRLLPCLGRCCGVRPGGRPVAPVAAQRRSTRPGGRSRRSAALAETVPQRLPPGGLVILRDGDTVEETAILSPLSWQIEHRAEIEVTMAGATAAARAALLDAILVDIAAAITADARSVAQSSGRSPARPTSRTSSSRAPPLPAPPPR